MTPRELGPAVREPSECRTGSLAASALVKQPEPCCVLGRDTQVSHGAHTRWTADKMVSRKISAFKVTFRCDTWSHRGEHGFGPWNQILCFKRRRYPGVPGRG